MKLRRLIESHNAQSVQGGLNKNFGDSYLLANNPIYAKIRQQTLKAGFDFQMGPDLYYQVLPLSQLEPLLNKKQIPYYDNISALIDIDKKLSDSCDWDDVQDLYKQNYLFHESCHAVARTFCDRIFGALSTTVELTGHRKKAQRLLFEESFANGCELLGIMTAQDKIHRQFYQLNSYIYLPEERSNLMSATETIGTSGLFKFVWLSYLCANFLRPGMNEKDLRRMLNLCGRSSKAVVSSEIKLAGRIAKIGFQLNPRFRRNTTGLYLRLCGLSGSIDQLLNFDFLEEIENSETYSTAIESLSSLICD